MVVIYTLSSTTPKISIYFLVFGANMGNFEIKSVTKSCEIGAQRQNFDKMYLRDRITI